MLFFLLLLLQFCCCCCNCKCSSPLLLLTRTNRFVRFVMQSRCAFHFFSIEHFLVFMCISLSHQVRLLEFYFGCVEHTFIGHSFDLLEKLCRYNDGCVNTYHAYKLYIDQLWIVYGPGKFRLVDKIIQTWWVESGRKCRVYILSTHIFVVFFPV